MIEKLVEVTTLVPAADRTRFAELSALLTTPARLPLGSDESHRYNERLFAAREEMLGILRRSGNDSRIAKLIEHYEGRETPR